MMLSANNAWRERNPRPTMNFIQKNWKGILVCLVMAVPCWLLGQKFPIVGGPVFGILAGMIVTLLWHDKSAAQPGISFVSKKVLQYAVILLGFGMNLSVIWQTGKQSLPIILVTITTSLVVSWLLHKLLHIPGKISTLIGVGSSICGGSAVAATASVIDADDEEVAQAIADGILQTIYAQEVESYEYEKEAETPYRIQLGFFNLEENARALQAQLLFLGYDAVIEPGEDGTYRVYSGSFEKLDNAAKMEQTLRKAGFSTYIVQ